MQYLGSHWLDDPQADTVDCVLFLLGWNLFWDVATVLGRPLRDLDPVANKIHDKLFFGNNLPAMTPEGCS
jgi:hypothetical protein